MNHGTLEEIESSPLTIDWTIPGFFELPKEIDYSVSSPEFKYLQYTCNFSAQPNGAQALNEAMILSLHGIGKDGTTQWEMEVRRANDTLLACSSGLKEDGYEAAMDIFISIKEAEVGCKSDGYLKVRCKLCPDDTLGFDKENDKRLDTANASRAEKLCSDMEEMLQTEDYHDATIRVKGRDFKVHRSVLGVRVAHLVFAYKEEFKEDYTEILDIDDCDPDAFMEFLRYMYSGRLGKFTHDALINLYKIADKWQVTELKMYCLEYLVDHLCLDYFCTTMVLCAKYNKEHLLNKCLRYFAENMAEITSTEEWKKLAHDSPVATDKMFVKAEEILEKKKSENDTFLQKLVVRIRGKR